MKRFLSAFLLVLTFNAYATSKPITPIFEDGDIILQTSQSSQSQAIQLATHSKWTHTGIIFYLSGTAYVYEAEGPVGYRSLTAWIASGLNGKYLVRRNSTPLTSAQVASLKSEGANYAGLPYDIYFSWDDSEMYCSELVWKIYDRALGISVGTLQKLGDMDLSSPQVQAILRQRYGDNIPYDETVITPQAISVSTNLVTVYQN